MATVELSHVRTWYAERGRGEPLVLLHGGAVDARFFDQNIETLAARFRVLTPDLRGHGHTPDVEGPFTYEALAHDTIEFIEAAVGGPVYLAGHSIGAGVALHVALRRPDVVSCLVLISAAFHHNGQIAVDEIDVDQVVAAFGASYGEVSPDGEDHYAVVVGKGIDMDRREPALDQSDLHAVNARTLIMAGDHDLITLEHTLALYRGITNAELAIVPGTSHFLTQEKPDLCTAIIADFIDPDTESPMIRRRTPDRSDHEGQKGFFGAGDGAGEVRA